MVTTVFKDEAGLDMYGDVLGDYLKEKDRQQTGQAATADEVLVVRLDGRSFSRVTASLAKPFDGALAECMMLACRAVVEDLEPVLGYTQSDEMTFLFDARAAAIKFGGELQHLGSVCAGLASTVFTLEALRRFPEEFVRRHRAHFDGRAVPYAPKDAALTVLWRETDARRNSALAAGRSALTQSQMQGKSPTEVKQMLLDLGIDYEGAFPEHFRRGTFMRRREVVSSLPDEVLARIPAHLREAKSKEMVRRKRIVEMKDVPPLYLVENLEDFILRDGDPVVVEKPFASNIMP
jgi:tRNA(His) guanylyltransferase